MIRANPGIELVTLGPLTNVALALARDPSIAGNVKRCVVMGGNPCCEGNVTPAAEYNIWCDPEAARIVLPQRDEHRADRLAALPRRGQPAANPTSPASARLDTTLAHFAIDINRVAMEANRTQCGEIGIAAARSRRDGRRARSDASRPSRARTASRSNATAS